MTATEHALRHAHEGSGYHSAFIESLQLMGEQRHDLDTVRAERDRLREDCRSLGAQTMLDDAAVSA